MDRPAHLDDYLEYLDRNPGIQARNHFKCGATRGVRPKLHNTLPGGDCFLYDEMLVFLTQSKRGAGWMTSFENVLEYFAADITLMRWSLDHTQILLDIGKSINSFLKPEEIEKSLTNPHSIFIPIKNITSLQAERDWTQGNYMIIRTKDEDVALAEHLSEHPNPMRDLLKGKNPLPAMNPLRQMKFYAKKVKGYAVGEWEPEVVSFLKSAVASR